MKRLHLYLTLALVSGIMAGLTGCQTTREVAGPENSYSAEQVRAIVQSERARTEAAALSKEETDKGERSLTSTIDVDVGEDGVIKTYRNSVIIGSNSGFKELQTGKIRLHQSEEFSLADGQMLHLPVGVEIDVGNVTDSNFADVPGQIDAIAARDTARAAGAAHIIEIDGRRQALLVELVGRNRVAAIDSAGQAVSGVIIAASPIVRGIDAATQVLTIQRDDGETANHVFAAPAY